MGNSSGAAAPPCAGVKELLASLSDDPFEVQVAASRIFQVAGVGAYHTSLIVGGREFYFDCNGIESAPPFWSHAVGRDGSLQDLNLEVRSYGKSALTGKALAKGLEPFFEVGSYDIIFKNCNHFTDAAVYFLARKRLDPAFSRVERMLASTSPVSMALINSVQRAAFGPSASSDASESPQWEYSTNPLAKGFAVEAVVAACDALDSEAAAPPKGKAWSVGGVASSACCARVCGQLENATYVVIPTTMDDEQSRAQAAAETLLAPISPKSGFQEPAFATAATALYRPDSVGSESWESPLLRPKAKLIGQRRQLPI